MRHLDTSHHQFYSDQGESNVCGCSASFSVLSPLPTVYHAWIVRGHLMRRACGGVFMAELTQAENTFHLDLVYGDGKIPANPLHGVPYFAKVYL